MYEVYFNILGMDVWVGEFKPATILVLLHCVDASKVLSVSFHTKNEDCDVLESGPMSITEAIAFFQLKKK